MCMFMMKNFKNPKLSKEEKKSQRQKAMKTMAEYFLKSDSAKSLSMVMRHVRPKRLV